MIELKENAGVKNIKTLYDMIGGELRDSDELLLDFAKVGRLDLSLVQLVIAAARSARERGKTVRLRSVSAKIREQLETCGIKA
jgi:anti-anti-sigma regulatory factor